MDLRTRTKIINRICFCEPYRLLCSSYCRGAIFGDTLSNLLKFNGNKVTKEYYINDYGGQIINFLKSVYLRIREIKYNEKFPNDKSLYPGEYIIKIANSIQKKKKIEFKGFDDEYEFLHKEALNLSMQMIKSDLSMLEYLMIILFQKNQ